MKSKKNICSVCLVLFFILVAGITLLPLILLAVASLSPGSELMRNGLNFNIDFAKASLNNYVQLFNGNHHCPGGHDLVPQRMCGLWVCHV